MTASVEMREAVKAARRREQTATKIRAARYDRRTMRLSSSFLLEQRSWCRVMVFRVSRVPQSRASPMSRSLPEASLWSDTVDDGVLLEQLLILAAGELTLGTIGARLNAAKKSSACAAASRIDGTKGGRPRKSAA